MKEKNERKKKNRKKVWERNRFKSRLRSVAGAVGLTMVVLATLCVFAQPALAAEISVLPAYQEVSAGENVTVDIYVNNTGNETWGVQYQLYFNNTLLNATKQISGPFLSQDGKPTTVYSNVINNSYNDSLCLGLIKYSEARVQQEPPIPGVTEPGVLATITFQAIAEENGVSEVRFLLGSRTKLTENPYKVIYPDTSNGTVSVKAGICGDVDTDEYITGGDATKVWDVATHVSPESILDSTWAADVDCDGYITGGDATKIWDVATHVSPETILNCC